MMMLLRFRLLRQKRPTKVSRFSRRAILPRLGRFDLPFDTLIHALDEKNLLLDIQPAAIEAELALALLDILSDVPPFVLVVLQTVGQPRPLEIGQDTSHDSVDGAKRRDGVVGPARCAEGCQRGRDHNLNAQTAVHKDAEKVVPLCGDLLGADDARVDADVARGTMVMVRDF